ncbi:MAG: serine protein kinase RIO, partial [Candidatus Micrarchaeota archaeon]|nr:serine protein kinase RIO [Candidatus Micrarchaeota archaeon]
IKEQLKIEEGIFDSRTIMSLWRMFNHNIVTSLDYMISSGKEADVYLAEGGSQVNNDLVALKIFRIETSDFSKRINYITGDPRFEKGKRDILSIVNTWCKKEYGNLKVAELAEVHAPRPYHFKGNVLAMEFIGSAEGTPAKRLKDTPVDNPEEVLDTVLEDIRKLYRLELVHADVSEYNILMNAGVPYLIDFGQAVVLKHPKANEFLERDVVNLLDYFLRKYRIERDW